MKESPIKFDKNNLILSNNVIKLNHDIWSYLICEELIIILFQMEKDFENNVCAIDPNGNVIWEIESLAEYLGGRNPGGPSDNSKCDYSGITYKNGQLKAYNTCGFSCKIDITSGKIINAEFTK